LALRMRVNKSAIGSVIDIYRYPPLNFERNHAK